MLLRCENYVYFTGAGNIRYLLSRRCGSDACALCFSVSSLGCVTCFAVTQTSLVKSSRLILKNTRGISEKCQCKARVLSKYRVHKHWNNRQSIVLINKLNSSKHGNLVFFVVLTLKSSAYLWWQTNVLKRFDSISLEYLLCGCVDLGHCGYHNTI